MFNRQRSMGFKLLLVLSFFLPMSAWAGHIIRITETSPFPTEVVASSTTTAVYTVTNNASRVSVTPVDQTQYPRGISRLSSSTCGGLLGPGQSCTVVLQLQAPSTPQTISFALKQWAEPSADGVQLSISVSVTPQPSPSALSIAVGNDASAGQPVVAVSTNRAVDWESAAISGLPANGQLKAASCTGSGATAICIGAGQSSTGSSGAALLVQSVNGGDTWAVKEVASSPAITDAIYNGASCTGSGSDAICIVVGQNRSLPTAPIIGISKDGGNSWAITFTSATTSAAYLVGSCTGSSASAICIAAGNSDSSGIVLDVSTNGGDSWSAPPVGPFPGALLRGASCTGEGSAAVCVAVGLNGSATAFAIVGTSGGLSWNSVDILGASSLALGVSCHGSGSTAVCAAVGSEFGSPSVPFISVSNDAGTSWTPKTVAGFVSSSQVTAFTAVSCSGGADAICAAVGEGATSAPTIAVSTDGGDNWAVRTVTNPPVSRVFLLTVNCQGTGATAVCVAGGFISIGPNTPVIITSNDGGTTWTVRSVTGFSPVTGIINGTAGAAGDTSLASFGTNSGSAPGGLSVTYPQKTFGIKNKLEDFIK